MNGNGQRQAIIYSRYSPRPEKAGGAPIMSCEFQIAECIGFARNQWLVSDAHVFRDEGLTGATLKDRPGLDAALRAVTACRGIFLVYSLSRMSRSIVDASRLLSRMRSRGVDFCSVKESLNTSTTMGRFVFTLIAALAEFERELISERTSDALMQRLARGTVGKGANPPYGFFTDDSGQLQPHPGEYPAVLRMVELRKSGWGWTSIAKKLRAEGFLSRRGELISDQVVRNACKGAAWREKLGISIASPAEAPSLLPVFAGVP